MRPDLDHPPLELWGGIECTVNRVGDRFFDQIARSGHDRRLDDLTRFAALGMRAIRYPLLWERTAPAGIDRANWRWADEQLGRLGELGLNPIVGLVHHGSGPVGTSLIEPSFVDGLARFAGAVAARYPWIDSFTPVNEPLTTARFSGLYGHWFPHGRDDRTFARALITQCQATAAAMRAIRRVTPHARLVQTEDLGQVYATPALRSQAAFENDRRWLSFDLLCGRVDRHHPLWGYLVGAGIEEGELDRLGAEPCPPDVVGINHYLTSERFLDHRLERYPAHTHGANERQAYADIEAVRVRADGVAGPASLLWQAWERYRLPMVVSETHLGCTREEQLRWFAAVWDAAGRVRARGADVRAVTLWSLLGAFDWDSLLTRDDGSYEPGVFDLRSLSPRPTALTTLAAELAGVGSPSSPVLRSPGWWLRPDRLVYRAVDDEGQDHEPTPWADYPEDAPPIAVVGDGVVADTVVRCCADRALPVVRLREIETSRLDPSRGAELLAGSRPWAVVYAPDRGPPFMTTHGDQPGTEGATIAETVASICAAHGLPLLLLSSGRVFGAAGDRPCVERDLVAPDDPEGHMFAAAERVVLATHPDALVVRLGPTIGGRPGDDPVTAFTQWMDDASVVATDAPVPSPAYLPDAIDAALDLLIDGEQAIWHLVGAAGATTLGDMARRLAAVTGQDPPSLMVQVKRELSCERQLPATAVLGSERGWILGSLDEGLRRWAWDRHRWRHEPAGSDSVRSTSLVRAERPADDPRARDAS